MVEVFDGTSSAVVEVGEELDFATRRKPASFECLWLTLASCYLMFALLSHAWYLQDLVTLVVVRPETLLSLLSCARKS